MNAVPLLNYAQVFNFTLHFKVVVTIGALGSYFQK